MHLKPIKSDREYKAALKRLEEIFDAAPNTEIGDEFEILTMLIEKYEEEHHKIDLPDPIEAIKFRMEQLGMNQQDLSRIIGYKSRVSEILNRKRKLTLRMIRSLKQHLSIPYDVLIQDY